VHGIDVGLRVLLHLRVLLRYRRILIYRRLRPIDKWLFLCIYDAIHNYNY
jgi:hypothetical protein